MSTIPRRVEWSYPRDAQPDALHAATLDASLATNANADAFRLAAISRSWLYAVEALSPYATITALNTWTSFGVLGAAGVMLQLPWHLSEKYQHIGAVAQVSCSFPDVSVQLRLQAGTLVTSWAGVDGPASSSVAFSGSPIGSGWQDNVARPHRSGSCALGIAVGSPPADRRIALTLQARIYSANAGTPYGGMSMSRLVYLNSLLISESHLPVVPT